MVSETTYYRVFKTDHWWYGHAGKIARLTNKNGNKFLHVWDPKRQGWVPLGWTRWPDKTMADLEPLAADELLLLKMKYGWE